MNSVIFQQNDASRHYALMIRMFLDANFKDRLIGRVDHISWPARSSNLSPLDFIHWGYVNDEVY